MVNPKQSLVDYAYKTTCSWLSSCIAALHDVDKYVPILSTHQKHFPMLKTFYYTTMTLAWAVEGETFLSYVWSMELLSFVFSVTAFSAKLLHLRVILRFVATAVNTHDCQDYIGKKPQDFHISIIQTCGSRIRRFFPCLKISTIFQFLQYMLRISCYEQ